MKHYDHKVMSVSELIPYANNSRTHSDQQIKQIASSIKEFGFTNPVLIDETNSIIAGHGRVLASELLNIDEVPVIVVDGLREAQKKALVIADNQLALNAGWDEEILKNEITDLVDQDFDIELLGFDDAYLDDILKPEPTKGLTDEDDVPDAPEQPVTVEGDVWILGNHRLMCGDSTSIDAVEKLMDGNKADMVFTDPPYNVDYVGKTKSALKIKNDKMESGLFYKFMLDCFSTTYTVCKEGCPIYITCPLEDGVFHKSFIESGFKLQSILIWVKNTMVMGRKDYHYKHEPILYGWKEGKAHYWSGGRDKTTVINCDKPNSNKMHPTMKPVKLIEQLLENSGRLDAIIYDSFGGSGSTLIACEKTNRNCYMMELDPKYCDVIINRWQDYTGKKAVHENGKLFEEIE